MQLFALAAAILALGVVYWLVRDQDRRERASSPRKMTPTRRVTRTAGLRPDVPRAASVVRRAPGAAGRADRPDRGTHHAARRRRASPWVRTPRRRVRSRARRATVRWLLDSPGLAAGRPAPRDCLSHRFELEGRPLPVLEHVSLSVEPGEFGRNFGPERLRQVNSVAAGCGSRLSGSRFPIFGRPADQRARCVTHHRFSGPNALSVADGVEQCCARARSAWTTSKPSRTRRRRFAPGRPHGFRHCLSTPAFGRNVATRGACTGAGERSEASHSR